MHNLSDVLGLVLAWVASTLARRRPSGRRTYGLRGSTILAALANALLLLVAVGAVGWEAIGRLSQPGSADGRTMWIVAGIGVLINAASAGMFLRGRKGDANVRGAFLHLAADAAVSLGVVVAGLAIAWTGWSWLDPTTSLVVSVVILVGTWSLLREALNLALAAVPDRIDLQAVREYLATLPGVSEVHDLHVWALSTTEVALTAHLVIPQTLCHPTFVRDICGGLHDNFGIEHSTLQIEPPGDLNRCPQAGSSGSSGPGCDPPSG